MTSSTDLHPTGYRTIQLGRSGGQTGLLLGLPPASRGPWDVFSFQVIRWQRSRAVHTVKLEFHDADDPRRHVRHTISWSYSYGKLNDTPTFSWRSSWGCRRGSTCRCRCPCPCRRRGMPAIMPASPNSTRRSSTCERSECYVQKWQYFRFVVAILKDGFAVNFNCIYRASVSSISPKTYITVLHRWDVSNMCRTETTSAFCPPYLFPVWRRHLAMSILLTLKSSTPTA